MSSPADHLHQDSAVISRASDKLHPNTPVQSTCEHSTSSISPATFYGTRTRSGQKRIAEEASRIAAVPPSINREQTVPPLKIPIKRRNRKCTLQPYEVSPTGRKKSWRDGRSRVQPAVNKKPTLEELREQLAAALMAERQVEGERKGGRTSGGIEGPPWSFSRCRQQ